MTQSQLHGYKCALIAFHCADSSLRWLQKIIVRQLQPKCQRSTPVQKDPVFYHLS